MVKPETEPRQNKTQARVIHRAVNPNAPGWTYEEIAVLLGVSAARVRQIERRAFEKIRRELKRRYGITAADVKATVCPSPWPRWPLGGRDGAG